jgi:gag-polypeptide of LTR copia-type
LIGRDKLEFVNEETTISVPVTSEEPTEDEKRAIREWCKNDNRVVRWLLATMEPHITKIMTYQNTAPQMWSKVEKLYGKKKNYSHIFQIQQELQLIKQQPNQSIFDLFSLLQEKIDELKLYRPPTANLEELQQREELDEVFRFLASLDSSYETVRSQILLALDLPSLDDVMARIEGEETRRVVMRSQLSTDQENKVFYS